jgi:TatD DNase family protein
MQLIDTHSHLFAKEFNEDIQNVIENSKSQFVSHVILPNIDVDTLKPMFNLYHQFPDFLKSAVGLHPCHVDENFLEKLSILEPYISNQGVVAIGETGLDYYWDLTYKENQKEALKIHIDWAKKYHKPIVLHTRESIEDCIAIIHQNANSKLDGVFHCFSGNLNQAQTIIEIPNFYLGIGGNITYKNSPTAQFLSQIPIEKILLETDSPYLAPLPFRGKRNESSYIIKVAEKVAEIYQLTIEEVAEITTFNAKKLFQL